MHQERAILPPLRGLTIKPVMRNVEDKEDKKVAEEKAKDKKPEGEDKAKDEKAEPAKEAEEKPADDQAKKDEEKPKSVEGEAAPENTK